MTVLDRLEQQTAEAEAQAARLRKMLELARELGEDGVAEFVALVAPASNGNAHATGNGHGTPQRADVPRGRDAVRMIVRERPGIWTYAELQEEMERLGWFTSRTGLEAAAKRLCDVNGEGKRIGKGRYVFPANHGEEVDSAQSDRSDGAMIPLEM